MDKKLGIPYMGSKRKISKKIVDYILRHNPNTKYVFDLFGGGGAMSFQFLQREGVQRVVYNELNTGVVELLKKIQKDGVTDEFYRWIDRDTFLAHKNDNTWFGGLVATCWSFGNNSKGYKFSKENERFKRPLHEIIVNKCEESIKEFYELSGLLIDKNLITADTINQRRLNVLAFVKKNLSETHPSSRLQQLEQLQQLERIQQLEQLQQLEISNKSYVEVLIDTPINETIIYLDPPYKDTAKYQHEIDYDKFYEWVNNSPYTIYVSSYEAPMKEVLAIEHRSTLSATANNKVVEKLFCNKVKIVDYFNDF
jgi:site-specific DNA-adenine methylase